MPRASAPLTLQTYAACERRYRAWIEGAEPTLENAQAYLTHLSSKGAKATYLFVVAHAIRRNLGLMVDSPDLPIREPQYLTVDQVRALIDASPTLLERVWFTVLFDTGCRLHEILELQVADLRLEDGVARVVRKGGREEDISLGQRSVVALREWLASRRSDSPRVFMDLKDTEIRYRLGHVAKKLRIKFHPHMLRHTRARQLYEAGVRLERISEILGHRRLDTTMKIYARFRAEDRAKFMDQQAPW